MPYSIVRGELLFLQASVFNYQSNETNVIVTLTGGGFQFDEQFSPNNDSTSTGAVVNERRVRVPADGGASVSFAIRAIETGEIELEATARAIDSRAGDAERRKLRVVPEGTTVFYNVPVFVDLRGGSANEDVFNEVVDVVVPRSSDNYVAESERVSVHFTGKGTGINYCQDFCRFVTLSHRFHHHHHHPPPIPTVLGRRKLAKPQHPTM